MKRICLIGTGWACVFLGTLGIFLPLLPTTVFLLIAAWCFARSSEKFHLWLTNHPRLGPFLAAWNSATGIPTHTRNRILLTLWGGMSISAVVVGKLIVTGILITVGVLVSILIFHKSEKKDNRKVPPEKYTSQDESK